MRPHRTRFGLTAPLLTIGALAALLAGCSDGDAHAVAQNGGRAGSGGSGGSDALPPPTGAKVTVHPTEIDELLYNPGMGVTEFHGWLPPPPEHPPATIAYWRWSWAEVEPAEGQYAFDLVDGAIAQAKANGQTLAFRIMPHWQSSSPQWLIDKGVGSVTVPDGAFPDHNDPLFLKYHQQLLQAFGTRYAGNPEIDHIDIGSVGCWGEWNTACCDAAESTCASYFPTEENQLAIVDWYFEYFEGTPLVALIGGQAAYATGKGSGWRGDCFGDYGMFGSGWNHMQDLYQGASEDPVIGNAWKKAPVAFEVCGVMQDWYDKGFDIDLILKKGLEWHMSVLNLKSSPVPVDWRGKLDEFLKHVGYRLVLRELSHTSTASPGGSISLTSRWENVGVAPFYHAWPLAYRLRSSSDAIVARWTSSADPRTWLPGAHSADDVVELPADVAPGTYSLDLAILDEAGENAHVELAISGKRADKWYPVSELSIQN